MDKGEYLRYVKKAGWKMTTSEVKTELTFMRVLYKIMEVFFVQPQNSLFSDATIFFSHSLVSYIILILINVWKNYRWRGLAWSRHRILPNSFKSENFLTYHYKYLECENTAEGLSVEWLVPSFEWSHPQTRKLQLDRKSSLLSLRVKCLSCFYSWGTTLSFLFFVFWHHELLL